MTMTFEDAAKLRSAVERSSTASGDAAAPGDDAMGDANGGSVPERVAAGAVRTGVTKNARFHIFVIDTAWNCAASKVLHEHLNMISDLNIDDELYVLDRATSIALLRHYPLQVGRDPIIAVHDLRPRHRHRIKHTHGFRMHLGILDSEQQVLSALKMFTRFLVTHRNAEDLDRLVRQDLHRQGLAGAVQIIGGHEHQKMIE
jgi:hypothetical protein